MRNVRLLLVAVLVLGWPILGSTAQSPARAEAVHVPAKPAPIRPDWKPFIGEYERGQEIANVLERNGRLFVSTRPDVVIELHQDGPARFTAADMRVVFRSEASAVRELDLEGNTFKRRLLGDVRQSFRITPLRPFTELREEALRAKPPLETGKRRPELVELTALDPTIKLDVRYATSNNFMGVPFYPEGRAFLQRPAAEALVRAHRGLRRYGYGLLIHDAYRPWFVTKMFWDGTPDDKKEFVADPAKGSNHNRGGAVDLSLYDLATGNEVEMPGGYDEMSDRSYPGYVGGTSLQRWHRDLLRAAMEAQGFTVYKFEWWHFDYKDWASYPILNVSFSEISRNRSQSGSATSPRRQ